MPIYEYQCQDCDHRLEALQRVSEPPLTTCPDCGGDLRKLLSAPAFQFKGSGWYVTDYARKNGEKVKGEKAREAGAEKGEKAGGGEAKAEKKGSGKAAAGTGT